MSRAEVAVCESPGARQIEAYRWRLGQQLKLPMQSVGWVMDSIDDTRPVSYKLSIDVEGVDPYPPAHLHETKS